MVLSFPLSVCQISYLHCFPCRQACFQNDPGLLFAASHLILAPENGPPGVSSAFFFGSEERIGPSLSLLNGGKKCVDLTRGRPSFIVPVVHFPAIWAAETGPPRSSNGVFMARNSMSDVHSSPALKNQSTIVGFTGLGRLSVPSNTGSKSPGARIMFPLLCLLIGGRPDHSPSSPPNVLRLP